MFLTNVDVYEYVKNIISKKNFIEQIPIAIYLKCNQIIVTVIELSTMSYLIAHKLYMTLHWNYFYCMIKSTPSINWKCKNTKTKLMLLMCQKINLTR